MRRALLACLAVAVLVASLASPLVAGSLKGGMTSNASAETTYVFAPSLKKGVLLVNPDAECAFAVGYNSAYKTFVLTGNSSLFIEGIVDEVIVTPTTSQRVGVYGSD